MSAVKIIKAKPNNLNTRETNIMLMNLVPVCESSAEKTMTFAFQMQNISLILRLKHSI